MLLRPALPIVLCYGAGIIAGRFAGADLAVLMALAGALTVALILVPRARLYAAGLLIFVLGWFNYSWRYEIHRPEDLRVVIGCEEAIVQVRGTLLTTPELRIYTSADESYRSTSAKLRVTAVERKGDWKEARGDVVVNTRGMLPDEFWKGQEVIVQGVIKEPASALAEGMFDFREFLFNQGIFYLVAVESARDWQQADRNQAAVKPLTVSFQEWAQPLLARGLPAPDQNVELIWSMVLGWKTGFTQEVAEPFMRTGTIHIFAISGLHVACIAWLFAQALRLLGLRRQVSAWVVIPLIWFYTVATGWQSSAVRSAIMSSVVILSWSLHRPPHLLNSLAVAALLVLAWEPQQLFQASFQLSFAVVGSIALFLPYLNLLQVKLLNPDPLLPPELRPRWQQNLDAPLKFVSTSFVISIASWLGALPITAGYFNLFTPVTLLANLFIVPISSAGLAASVATLVLSPLAAFFNALAWTCMDLTVRINHVFANFGYFYVPKPTLAFFIFYYLTFLLLLTGALKKPKWLFPGLTLILLSGLIFVADLWMRLGRSELTMLPIKGTPLFFHARAGEEDLMIDCSNAYGSERFLKPFLRARGLNQLDNLALSHGDIDHVEGYDVMKKEFAPRKILTSSASFRSPTYKDLTVRLESSSAGWNRLNRGEHFAGWEILHPPAGDRSPRADDKALVLRRRVEEITVLHLSDLSADGRNRLLNTYPGLSADIVFAGVPEQGEPIPREWLERLGAQLLVVGTLQTPRKSFGSIPWVQALKSASVPVWLTGESGSVKVTFARDRCIAEGRAGQWLEVKRRE